MVRARRLWSLQSQLRSVTLADALNLRVVGFAFICAWALIVFFSTLIHYSSRSGIAHLNTTKAFAAVGMVLILCAAASFSAWFEGLLRKRLFRLALPCVLAASTVFLTLVEAGLFMQPWCLVASLIVGVCLALLLILWGEVFMRLEPARCAVAVMAALPLAALIVPVVTVMPPLIALSLTALLPLVSWLVVERDLRRPLGGQGQAHTRMRQRHFLVRAAVSAAFMGLAQGVMYAVFLTVGPVWDGGAYEWVFLAAALLSVVVISATLLSRQAADYGLAFRLVLCVLAIGFLLLPLLGGTLLSGSGLGISGAPNGNATGVTGVLGEGGVFCASTLAFIGYCVVRLFAWIVITRVAQAYQLSAVVAFGYGIGAVLVGDLAGYVLGNILLAAGVLAAPWLHLMSCIAVCTLFFSYLFIFDSRGVMRLTSASNSSEGDRHPFRNRCEEVAHNYRLTQREQEILVLLAKGRSLPRIQQELHVSAGTANTHQSRIYRKLGIHDRQELLDLIEDLPTHGS